MYTGTSIGSHHHRHVSTRYLCPCVATASRLHFALCSTSDATSCGYTYANFSRRRLVCLGSARASPTGLEFPPQRLVSDQTLTFTGNGFFPSFPHLQKRRFTAKGTLHPPARAWPVPPTQPVCFARRLHEPSAVSLKCLVVDVKCRRRREALVPIVHIALLIRGRWPRAYPIPGPQVITTPSLGSDSAVHVSSIGQPGCRVQS